MDKFNENGRLRLERTSTLEGPFVMLISIIGGIVFLKISVSISAFSIVPAVFIMSLWTWTDLTNLWRRFRWAAESRRLSAAGLIKMIEKGDISKIEITYYGGFDAIRLTPSAVASDNAGIIYRVPYMWYWAVDKIKEKRPDLIIE